MISLNPLTTALVLIDLQKGIVGSSLAPHTASEVVNVGVDLARRFRGAGSSVILVNVAFAADLEDVLRQPVDRPWPIPPGGFPAGFSDLVSGLAEPSDLRITKRQWGAFYGTDLDLQLRRRGIRTIVLGGVSTNIGVESTARQAYEYGYEVVIAEDATTSRSAEMHAFSVGEILPLLGRVAPSSAIELWQD
ncbi:hydrolase [Singulisphaera acidiphila]|uniref:Nicotinamidase-like amidase n=1 Tax=Singulisphaera acidiphila (strain ATCC BAA-1392 / DSM 18658 / VKM B-2454 / MOB10) TaxID=886293 RepID=L0DB14_SINAD|nr:hydrolase [Singulisphaera acidiphila]AGA26417.1 nicotinamidase-like amidase [Singulisphaera acidiphila DSM 18658]